MRKGKDLLVRIVAMLTRMIERGSQVREGEVVYGYGYGYVNEKGKEEQSGQRVQATRNSSRLTPDVGDNKSLSLSLSESKRMALGHERLDVYRRASERRG